MPTRPCPACAATALRHLSLSEDALVHYYRCDGCGHVFTNTKGAPEAPPVQLSHEVTETAAQTRRTLQKPARRTSA